MKRRQFLQRAAGVLAGAAGTGVVSRALAPPPAPPPVPVESWDAGEAWKKQYEYKVRRFGLKIEVSEEAIRDSQWEELAEHMRAAGAALHRRKCELILGA